VTIGDGDRTCAGPILEPFDRGARAQATAPASAARITPDCGCLRQRSAATADDAAIALDDTNPAVRANTSGLRMTLPRAPPITLIDDMVPLLTGWRRFWSRKRLPTGP
jgi:hypothetical protein